jgi:hypothetical protein
MVFFRKSLSFVAVLTLAALAQAAPQRIRQAIDNNQTTVLHGGISHLARPELDRGPVSPATKIRGASIVFNRTAAQQEDAARFMAELQDPKSPNFHKWITPQQYADRFGMSQADIDKVVSWLRSQGLHVDSVSNSRTQIYFSGTVAQIQAALRTQLHQFAQDSEMHFANVTEPALPAAIAGSVLAVRNLNDFRPKPRKMHVRKVPAAQPHFNSGNGSHFISPDDLAIIYNIKPLYDAGITGAQAVAVVGQTEIAQSDVAAFRTAAGLPANPFQALLMPNTGASTVVDADVLEADLDVEWSGAVAKNAAILYVYTGNGKRSDNSAYNVIDAFGYVIDNNLAPVISISYGLCEASAGSNGRDFLQTLASEAVMNGQTISSATGDEGAADCEDSTAGSATHGLAVDLPSAIPEVTGVGGSEFSGDVSNASTYWAVANTANNASAISYIPESAWNDSTQTIASGDGFSAGGGGVSAFFAKPSWQTGTGVPNDGKRDVPDIALNASAHHDGYLVCSQGNCKNGGFVDTDNTILLVGGTSVGAPVFAGVVGLLNQAAQTNGQGNVNRQLYPLAASTPAAFHDITTGDNKVPCTAGSTGCTSANSHLVAASRMGWFGAAGGLMLVSFVAICVPTRRRRWLAVSGPLLIALLAVGIGCGGNSTPTTPSTPPPTPETGVSIGYSAGVGYDLATGLGSIDAHTLVTNWLGVPAAPSFTIVASPAELTAAANQPAVSSLNISSTTGFTGTIALSCASASGNVQVSCAVAPASVTLNSGTISAGATLTTHAPANTHAILVKGTSGSVVQFEKVTLTSQ